MEYKATAPRKFMAFLLVLSLGLVPSGEDLASWFNLILFLLITCSFFITYTMNITEDKISYAIQFFGLFLYKKQAPFSDIKKVIFKRAGWATKLAVIKTDKGFPIHVMLFKPEHVFEELTEFCNRNKVEYERTKDFDILNRRDATRKQSL